MKRNRINQRLKERKKFIETYNKVFNHNATVRYSDAWLKGYEKYMETIEEGGDEYEEV